MVNLALVYSSSMPVLISALCLVANGSLCSVTYSAVLCGSLFSVCDCMWLLPLTATNKRQLLLLLVLTKTKRILWTIINKRNKDVGYTQRYGVGEWTFLVVLSHPGFFWINIKWAAVMIQISKHYHYYWRVQFKLCCLMHSIFHGRCSELLDNTHVHTGPNSYTSKQSQRLKLFISNRNY